ncbi:MAG: hypothetical protein KME57_23725 [Scytonema hyalinum WJT4-NPBG1]|jgi:hypothetical protein|nr:hypothetical protein [Scytonema hyalinum WJT4-NPBG1]
MSHDSLVRVREFQALLLSLFFDLFIPNLPTYVALSSLKSVFYNLNPIKNLQKK